MSDATYDIIVTLWSALYLWSLYRQWQRAERRAGKGA